MSSSKRAAIGVTVGILIGIIFKEPTNDRHSQGNVNDSKLQEVKSKFDDVLLHEREGLAMAAYHNDELIVDLWGGYADRSAARIWEQDTMSLTFSASKGIGALIVAIFVSRQYLQYDDLVTKYWPEFGQHGKENVTIQWILEHKAGLTTFDGEISMEQAHDPTYISKLIEQSKPKWPPGTASGYHALTQGWLIDQILRRADPKKRSIAQFYKEEIQPFMKDKDFYIGLPRELYYRVARIEHSTSLEILKAFVLGKRYRIHFWNRLVAWDNAMNIACSYPQWLSVMSYHMPYNSPFVQEVENVAAVGIGTARGLASAASTIIQRNMISDKVWKMIRKPNEYVYDKVAKLSFHRGHGFFYEPHPIHKDAFLMIHMGHGMQKVAIDPFTKTTIAFLRNLLRWDEASAHAMEDISAEILRKIDTA